MCGKKRYFFSLIAKNEQCYDDLLNETKHVFLNNNSTRNKIND